MRITVAIDSFKGSLSTFQAGEAVSDGIKAVYADASVFVSPLADGGEGTVDAIVSAAGGVMNTVMVCNPLGNPVESSYGIVGKTAVMEMSSAAGITLIEPEERNPLFTTTFGVGEMIIDAISRGCRDFIIGIGGSATNDGGVGMLQALGFEFLDSYGKHIPKGAIGLKDLSEIRTENALNELGECSFRIACDVKNVLCGEGGCSSVFGPQKGATPDMVADMDSWLMHYAELTEKIIPDADKNAPGTGAAGGLGFALMNYLGGRLESGVNLVIGATGLEEHIKQSDVVVTGEGRLDGQSYMGKAPIGVASLAKKYGKTVIAFAGCVADDASVCNDHGIDAFFPVLRTPCTLDEAMDTETAYKNLKSTSEQAFRLIKAIMG